MKRRLRLAMVMFMNRRIRLGLLLLLSATVATPQLLASASARKATGELRRDSAVAAFGRGGEQRPADGGYARAAPRRRRNRLEFAPGALDKMDVRHAGPRRQETARRHRHAGRPSRQGRAAQGLRRAEPRDGAPMKLDDRAHLLDDQADRRCGDDDVVRRGQVKPSDPIAKHIPEFANLKVYAGEKDGQPVYEAPAHPPTMGELMSHSARFTYGLFGSTPVDKLYQAANPLGEPSLQAFITRWRRCRSCINPDQVDLQRVGRHPGLSRRKTRARRSPSSCDTAGSSRSAWSTPVSRFR